MRSLVSCSTSEVTPPPADGGTFETLDELKEAVESAGLACQELVLDTPLPSSLPPRQAVASFTSLAIYSDDLHMESELDFWRPAWATRESTSARTGP